MGKKITLRKLKVTDALYAHDTYEDLKNTMYNKFNSLNSVDDFTMYLMDYTSRYETGESVGWAIISNKTNEFIGVIQIPNFYALEKNCTLSFYTVKGLKDPYIVESIKLVIEYIFSSKLVHRIQCKIDAEDSFSEIALIKTGFVYEGTQRQYAVYGDKYHDVKVYSILEEEIVLSEEK